MAHLIRWYHKTEDYYCGETSALNVPIDTLNELYPASYNDPKMYYCYDITEKEASFFKQYIDIEFNFDKYDYFLEYSNKE